jgi:hypothetical protein
MYYTLNQKPTEKQLNMIVHQIEGNYNSMTLKQLWDRQPKNNYKYTNEKCDYRRQILFEALQEKIKSRQYANLIITVLNDKDYSKLINIFNQLELA